MDLRALIRAYDHTGLVELAHRLSAFGFTLYADAASRAPLADAGLAVRLPDSADVPSGYGVVVCNLRPFKEALSHGEVVHAEALGAIDTAGSALLRSAAIRYRDTIVLTDPADYPAVMDQIEQSGDIPLQWRFRLAGQAFEYTSHDEALIRGYFRSKMPGGAFPQTLTLTYEKVQDLRYGENPHQSGAFYREVGAAVGTVADVVQLHGDALSYNNLHDANRAVELLKEFDRPAAVVVKDASPCGVALAADLKTAYLHAFEADPVSIYGGVVALSRTVEAELANEIVKRYLDIILAPAFTDEALEVLRTKKRVRILQLANITQLLPVGTLDARRVGGGLLVQQRDDRTEDALRMRVVTRVQPEPEDREDMLFAMKVAKHVRSNAMVVVRGLRTVGIGSGQPNRVNATRIAVMNGGDGCRGAVMASDAFLTFHDTIDAAAAAGIRTIIQPGGSKRDQEIIDACDRHGIAMVFTGIRHLLH